MTTETKKAKDLVQSKFESRMKDLRTLKTTEKFGSLEQYALSINVVEPGTFDGQRERYVRYQLYWGGPSDEFRIYENGDVEYWYMDRFDRAKVDVKEDNADIIKAIVKPIWSNYRWSIPEYVR